MAEFADEAARRLAEARAGSRDALGQALDACRAYLLLVAQKELEPDLHAKGGASDLVQETLLEALRDFGRFQGNSEPELLAWLRRLLLHNLTDFQRRYRETGKRQLGREQPLEPETPSEIAGGGVAADTPSPSGHAIEHEQFQAIERAMARLPDDYRQVIRLRYLEERSFEQIAETMQRSPNAVRKLWLRAVERLQQEMETPP